MSKQTDHWKKFYKAVLLCSAVCVCVCAPLDSNIFLKKRRITLGIEYRVTSCRNEEWLIEFQLKEEGIWKVLYSALKILFEFFQAEKQQTSVI